MRCILQFDDFNIAMITKCYIYHTDFILMIYILELLTCISNIVTAVETNVCNNNNFWFFTMHIFISVIYVLLILTCFSNIATIVKRYVSDGKDLLLLINYSNEVY